MNTKHKWLTLGLVAALALISIAGVKVSRMTRTTTFASNSLFIVVTGTTTKVTRHVQAHDLARGLGPWITNAGSGGVGEVTTVQLNAASNAVRSAALANVSGVGSNLLLKPSSVGVQALTINAIAGQSGDIAKIFDKDGNLALSINKDGALFGLGGIDGPRLKTSSTVGQVWTATGTDGTGNWIAPVGGGDVTTAQLNTASNALVAYAQPSSGILDDITAVTVEGFLAVWDVGTDNATTRTLTESGNGITIANPAGVAGDPLFSLHATLENAVGTGITTNGTAISNALVTLETTRNAAVSNALASLVVANDTTTSNGVISAETTRNAAVSNSLVIAARFPKGAVFFDDFSRSIINTTNLGTSASGHTWFMQGADAGASMSLSNGFWRSEGSPSVQAWYAGISNNVGGHAFSRWGGICHPIRNPSPVQTINTISVFTLLLSDNFLPFSTDPAWLHINCTTNQIYFQKGLGEIMHMISFTTPLALDTSHPWEIQYYNGIMYWSVGPHSGWFYHLDLAVYATKAWAIYENFDLADNSIIPQLAMPYAGYATSDKLLLAPPVPKPSYYRSGGTNVQWRLVKNGVLTNVLDVSAAAYYPSNGTFFTVHNNNNGRITEWTLDGVFVRSLDWTAGHIPDAESITYLGGNKFAIIEEDANLIHIFGITNNASGSTLSTNNCVQVKIPASVAVDGAGSGVEGIAYDIDRRGWWIAHEKLPAQLMIITNNPSSLWFTNNWFTSAQMQTFTNASVTDFTDLYYDRDNQILWVGQDEGGQFDRVIGIDLITSNVLFTVAVTNFGQLEGVCILPEGKLLVTGEANQFAIFEPVLGGLNTGISWDNFSLGSNGPAVPTFPFSVTVLGTQTNAGALNTAAGVTNWGALHNRNTVTNQGAVKMGSTLEVSGASTMASVQMTGSATISGNVNVSNAILTNNLAYVENVVTGVGGANTNFTLLATYGKVIINGFTNFSLRAIMGGTAGLTHAFSITITNGSGSNRTLEFSSVTNDWKWSYAQGGIAPTVMTNSEQIVITGELRNTNVTAAYAYYPWP